MRSLGAWSLRLLTAGLLLVGVAVGVALAQFGPPVARNLAAGARDALDQAAPPTAAPLAAGGSRRSTPAPTPDARGQGTEFVPLPPPRPVGGPDAWADIVAQIGPVVRWWTRTVA
jgi:hypothetical protein